MQSHMSSVNTVRQYYPVSPTIIPQSAPRKDTQLTPLTVLPAQPGDEDAHLLAGLRNGEESAFQILMDRYYSMLIRLARVFVPSEAIAEEVVQETWIGVLEGIHRFEGRSYLKTWLFRILTNRAKTRGGQERRYVPLVHHAEAEEGLGGIQREEDLCAQAGVGGEFDSLRGIDEQSPERVLLSKEGVQQIDWAIRQLPHSQQLVIVMRDVEGMSASEVCEALEVSETNQRVLLHRARTKVRAAMQEYMAA